MAGFCWRRVSRGRSDLYSHGQSYLLLLSSQVRVDYAASGLAAFKSIGALDLVAVLAPVDADLGIHGEMKREQGGVEGCRWRFDWGLGVGGGELGGGWGRGLG